MENTLSFHGILYAHEEMQNVYSNTLLIDRGLWCVNLWRRGRDFKYYSLNGPILGASIIHFIIKSPKSLCTNNLGLLVLYGGGAGILLRLFLYLLCLYMFYDLSPLFIKNYSVWLFPDCSRCFPLFWHWMGTISLRLRLRGTFHTRLLGLHGLGTKICPILATPHMTHLCDNFDSILHICAIRCIIDSFCYMTIFP